VTLTSCTSAKSLPHRDGPSAETDDEGEGEEVDVEDINKQKVGMTRGVCCAGIGTLAALAGGGAQTHQDTSALLSLSNPPATPNPPAG
jgi:hypothetical protein